MKTMEQKKDQTIAEYAKYFQLPLRQILHDLEKSGLLCNPTDTATKEIRHTISTEQRKRENARHTIERKFDLHQQEKIANKEELPKLEIIKQEEERVKWERTLKLEVTKKEEEIIKRELSIKNAKIEADDILCQIKKIGNIIDIVLELIPDRIRGITIKGINNNDLSGYYISSTYNNFAYKATEGYVFNKVKIHESIYLEYRLWGNANDSLGNRDLNSNANLVAKSVIKLTKENSYTKALLQVILLLIRLHPSRETSNNKDLYFISNLLIAIGAIESALKLYKVDERFFSNPNNLSALISCSIQTNDLNNAIQLTSKLIEQEPFHPSVKIIQAGIKRIEQRHNLKTNFSIDFSKINELSGIEFEDLLIDKFSLLGFKVDSTPKTGDFGADIIIENNEGSRIIIQCKRFKSKVNLKAVQEVVGAMGYHAGDVGIVITNSLFLKSATTLAESHDIELWDGDNLVSFLAGDLSFSNSIGDPFKT